MEPKEVYRNIKGFPGYQVSNYGNVRSITKYRMHGRNKHIGFIILKGSVYSGYHCVWIYKGKKSCKFLTHRLVALSFIPNKLNKPCVNHKNGIKTDNRVSNLEWVTHSENNKHARRIGLTIVTEKQRANFLKSNKNRVGELHHGSVKVINNYTGVIYTTIKDAAKYGGYNVVSLAQMLRGRYKNKTNLSIYGK